jgi:hypothetical protein
VSAILLPSGKLLVPVVAADPEAGIALREIGPDHPNYGRWLAAGSRTPCSPATLTGVPAER